MSMTASATSVGTGVGITLGGSVYTVGGTGIPQVAVTLARDGIVIANATTGVGGVFSFVTTAPSTPGDHTYQAHAEAPAGIDRADSLPILVKVRRPPAPPQSLAVTADGERSIARVSWLPPADTHGAPLTSYKLTRASSSGSVVLGTFTHVTLSHDDATAEWNASYRYYVQATTFAGDSVPTFAEMQMPAPTVATIDVNATGIEVCAPGCQSRAPGTTTIVESASASVRVSLLGRAYTAAGEAAPATPIDLDARVDVACASCSPSMVDLASSATTNANGLFSRTMPSIAWMDFAPGECRSLVVTVAASAGSGAGSGITSYELCRAG